MKQDERVVWRYDLADDWLPLHREFYQFIQEDKDGLFIVMPDGTRMPVQEKPNER